MGSIIGGVASLFGGRGRRREQRAANEEFSQAKDAIKNFQFSDIAGGLEARTYDAVTGQAPEITNFGRQGELSNLGDAQGYDAQGYDAKGYTSQGYNAAQTGVAGLNRGADAGLSNTMNNLQVSTAGSDLAAQEADQSLAASQDLAAQAGTGGGGATAIAAAAAKSKAGISADIDKQVKANEMLRAKAEGELQRNMLAQDNTASSFDLNQAQFNVGQDNQSRQFTAAAANQAAQFGANAQNQAAQFGAAAANRAAEFGAGAGNQFGLAGFDAGNKMSMFNVGNEQNMLRDQYRTQGQFGLQNLAAQNRAAEFGASADMKMQLAAAGYKSQQEQLQYGQNQDVFGIASGRKADADKARRDAKGALLGGIGAAINPVAGLFG